MEMDEPKNELSPAERIVRDVVRELVMDEVYIAERNGESVHARLYKLLGNLHTSGTGLLILTKIGWPKHVSDVINELLEEVRWALRDEERFTEELKWWRERDKEVGVDLDENTDIVELDGRYFVRPVRTEYAVGVNLDDE